MNKTAQDQRLLSILALYNAPIDGIDGPKTESARVEFCENEDIIPYQDISDILIQKIQSLPELDYSGKEKLAEVVKSLCKSLYADNVGIWAYIMATVEHETNATFYPVEEAYYLNSERSRQHYLQSKKYWPCYGVGHTQLTWYYNYQKYSDILNLGFTITDKSTYEEVSPIQEIFLQPDTSLFITIHGILTGTFTGRSIHRYINANGTDYVSARRVVNGYVDENRTVAKKIAVLAKKWEDYYVIGMEKNTD